MSAKIVDANEAVSFIKDGSTIAFCGCENVLLAEKVASALEERFLASGHPRDLTEIHPIIFGMGPGLGLEHFAHEGMLKQAIGSGFSYLKTSQMVKLMEQEKVRAYVAPMGTMFQMMSAIASGEPFTLTKVGIGTFVDCDVEGGCMNKTTPNVLCHKVTVEDEEYLCYDNPRIDVAVVRGTTADEFGNVSMEEEPARLGVLSIAMAAKACGGTVIVQVKRLAARGILDPKSVIIPGILVDKIVVDPEQQTSGGDLLNPALTGEIRMPMSSVEPLPFNITKIISRRAFREINKKNAVVNLGVGIPVNVPRIQMEEKSDLDSIFFPEHGSVGGVPGDRAIFGTNINPDAIIDSTNVFQIFRGGGLDISFLGMGEVDEEGNVNVSKFNGIVPGCGGFIDIAHKTEKLVFCGSFSAGSLDVEIKDGKLNIRQEGKYQKFVKKVQQITLNGQIALKKGQKVTYVTERAVFVLTEKGLRLIEYAPGIDIKKDILDQIPFPVIAQDPKLMDESMFRE